MIRGKIRYGQNFYPTHIDVNGDECPYIERDGKYYDKTTLKEVKIIKKTMAELIADYKAERDAKIKKANE